MKNSIGLAGDLDDVELVYDVEKTFDITLTTEEAERTVNVGQLFDLVEAKSAPNTTTSCLSQHAFYRLREALRASGITSALAPNTPVSVLDDIPGSSVHKRWVVLANRSALELPFLEGARPVWWTALVACAAIVFGLAALLNISNYVVNLVLVVCFVFPMLLFIMDRLVRVAFGRVPHRFATLGDLAREAAGNNFSSLAKTKRGSSPSDRWFALVAILRRHSAYGGKIDRETTFIAGR